MLIISISRIYGNSKKTRDRIVRKPTDFAVNSGITVLARALVLADEVVAGAAVAARGRAALVDVCGCVGGNVVNK